MDNKDAWGFPVEERKSDYFNFKVGDTKLRVMTQPTVVKSYFKDGKYTIVEDNYSGSEKTSIKGWAWCILRETGEIQVVKFPYSVIKEIQQYLTNDEYAFEGFPMPYDITITATGEGMERRYKTTPSRKNSEVTKEELEALAKKPSIKSIVDKMRGKVEKVDKIEYPEGEPEDVPF